MDFILENTIFSLEIIRSMNSLKILSGVLALVIIEIIAAIVLGLQVNQKFFGTPLDINLGFYRRFWVNLPTVNYQSD